VDTGCFGNDPAHFVAVLHHSAQIRPVATRETQSPDGYRCDALQETPDLLGDKRSHLTAYTSGDDGKTWSRGLLTDERVAMSYPNGVQADDGRIFLVYDYLRRTDKESFMAVISEADLDAGKIVGAQSRLLVLVHKATGQR